MADVTQLAAGSGSTAASRIPELDGLRALAISLVLLGHFGQFSLGRGGVWTHYAEAGVLVFFVLSGFLITSLLITEDREAADGVDLRRFYIRRALRLLPAAWTLIVVVATLKLFGFVTDENWTGVAASLLYVRNVFGTGATLGHLWSLSLEEQFYFVWPLLFVLLPRHRLVSALSVVAVVVFVRASGIGLNLQDVGSGVFYMRPWYRFDSIMVGCVVALLKGADPAFFRAPPRWVSSLTHPIVGFGLLAAFSLYEGTPALLPWALTLQTIACVVILVGLLVRSSAPFTRVLSSRPVTALGRASYSLYLWQQVFVVTKVPDWGWIRRPYFDLLASVVCAAISWQCIERVSLRYRQSVVTP